MVGRALAKSRSATAEIILLPFAVPCLGAPHSEFLIERVSALRPGRVGGMHLRVAFDRANQRFDLLDKTAPHRENHAEWLTPLERYRGVLASEFPVHREGKGSPISFDDAGQRLDRVLWLIERSGYHEVIPRLGA